MPGRQRRLARPAAGLVLVLGLGFAGSNTRAEAGFVPLDAAGQAVAPGSEDWSCSLDRSTGLVWEVKTLDGSVRDRRWTYTPYDSNPATNGGYVGFRDTASGKCVRGEMPGGSCNTEAYVEHINGLDLCGYDDWRLPTAAELTHAAPQTTIEPPRTGSPMLPNIAEGWYWTGVTRVGVTAFSRVVLLPPAARPAFYDGSYMVVLVRGQEAAGPR
ncbi:MAG: DUF1566 domain-containing protein [Gammaproteobacteria bacterium]